jgi:nitrogen PTS system EIIA component
MDIAEFLTPGRVLLDVRARDKTQLINEVAKATAKSIGGVSADAIAASLTARERLGSTGLGDGFALPHARIEGLDRYAGLFLRLAKPLAFDSIDGNPVSLVFALLIPAEGEKPHVAALAAISRRFRDTGLVSRLWAARTAADAFALLSH